MITKTGFRMVEVLSRADIDDHPMWADFIDGTDRARVLGWGVAADDLDRELRKYDYCGRNPLYPVLDVADADSSGTLVNSSVALRFELENGRQLSGYRVGTASFVLFVEEREFCLNPSLPGRCRAEAARLAETLGLQPGSLLPLRFVECIAAADGQPKHGTIEAVG